MRIKTSRAVAAVITAALALTSLDLVPAEAAGKLQTVQTSAGTIQMSARRHWRRGNAAVLGAVAGLFGTIAVVAANERYRDGYYSGGGPYDGPYGYGGPYGYAPYRYGYWHHHHWR